ncbi:MAG: L-threonylcarbamoyladenylate synthase [Roseiarcus sp.]|jgi:L-threonylcarbamoyladenylate synthase
MPSSHRRITRIAPADAESIAAAAACLRAGGLVAMPTETVYGLAADATSDTAVAAIFAAKGRPVFNPLIAHVVDQASAEREAVFDENAKKLARAFWPGPLTIVAPVSPGCRVSLLARAGLDSLALRVPANRIARALIEVAGVPLAAPSANRSGRVSPTRAEHVAADLDGRIDWILDAGPTPLGLESTIVACLGGTPRLLRPGAIARERIEAELGLALASELSGGAAEAPIAPGLLKSHYAPRATLRLAARQATSEEAALDFGGALAASPARTRLDLSPDGDLDEAAANLFAYLRALDATGARTIAVAPIPWSGLGAAINDRLRRAAAPRDSLI